MEENQPEYKEHLETIWNQFSFQSMSASDVDLCLQGIKIDDSHQDVQYGMRFRIYLIEAAGSANRKDLTVIHFPWIATMAKKHPDLVTNSELVSLYFNALWSITSFSDIPLSLIHEIMEDYSRLAQSEGVPERTRHQNLRNFYIQLGDMKNAKIHHEQAVVQAQLSSEERFWGLGFAIEFDLIWESVYYFNQREFSKAYEVLQPVLEEEIVSDHYLHYALGNALAGCILLENFEDGHKWLNMAERFLKKTSIALAPLFDALNYLSFTQNKVPALRLFERILRYMEKEIMGFDEMDFLMATHFLFLMLDKTGEPLPKLRFPVTHPLFRENHTYSAKEIADWALKEATIQQKNFDERNETTHFQDWFALIQRHFEKSRHVPIQADFA